MIAVICVTRSGHVMVQTLVTLLRIYHNISIEFVEEVNRTRDLRKFISKFDRIVWVEYGVVVESLDRLLDPSNPCVIVPTPRSVDWKQFSERSLSATTEPVHQRGLRWDTWVQDNEIVQTSPHLWALNTKPVRKKLVKSEMPVMEMFWEWIQHTARLKPKVIGDLEVQMVFSHVLSA